MRDDMNSTRLVAEYVVVGSLLIIGLVLTYQFPIDLGLNTLKEYPILLTVFISSLAYVIGFFTNVIAEIVFNKLYCHLEYRWMEQRGNSALILDYVRHDLYVGSSPSVINRLEYHRSLLRVSRSVSVSAFALVILNLLSNQILYSVISLTFLLLAFLSFSRRVQWITKSTFLSWEAQKRKNQLDEPHVENLNISKTEHKYHVLAFTGGSAFREINVELVRDKARLTRIVPIWDSGGSSKILREHFDVIPIGDVRQALMTMAHGEGQNSNVIRLFNWRLPNIDSHINLDNAFKEFVDGKHPLIRSIEPSLRNVILGYLKQFESALPVDDFNFRRGSLGNFVLIGAYLTHAKNINTAIYVFRQLCSINGEVYPVSLQSQLHLGAELEDGEIIYQQATITKLNRQTYREKIKRIFVYPEGDESKNPPKLEMKANNIVLEELETASIIIFGPGSFFTSVLPHLKVEGIVDAIAKLHVPKVLICNIKECEETHGYTQKALVDFFINTAKENESEKRSPHLYLTHVLANNNYDQKTVPGTNELYIPIDKDFVSYLTNLKIKPLIENFESTWRRGEHDPKVIIESINKLGLT